jgi:phage-related protein
MPSIGSRCHELRIRDADNDWRVFYRTDPDAVLILGIFSKKTQTTPLQQIRAAQRRLDSYDSL